MCLKTNFQFYLYPQPVALSISSCIRLLFPDDGGTPVLESQAPRLNTERCDYNLG